MRRVTFVIALTASLVLAACGGKKQDPVDLITSAAEESSAVETTAEETTAEAESIVAEMPSIEGETVAVYEYEVFDDAEDHLITYWTDGVTRKTGTFRNLMIPEWGIERIALPNVMFADEASVYHLKPGEVITSENFDKRIVYDDSVNYNGAFSIRTGDAEFRVWRAKIDDYYIKNPEAAKPTDLFIACYPFSDITNFKVDNRTILNLVNDDGTVDYLIDIMDTNHWASTDDTRYAYGGKLLIRPRDGIAHCVLFADSKLEEVAEETEYIFFNSIKLTAVEDITKGEICERQ